MRCNWFKCLVIYLLIILLDFREDKNFWFLFYCFWLKFGRELRGGVVIYCCILLIFVRYVLLLVEDLLFLIWEGVLGVLELFLVDLRGIEVSCEGCFLCEIVGLVFLLLVVECGVFLCEEVWVLCIEGICRGFMVGMFKFIVFVLVGVLEVVDFVLVIFVVVVFVLVILGFGGCFDLIGFVGNVIFWGIGLSILMRFFFFLMILIIDL